MNSRHNQPGFENVEKPIKCIIVALGPICLRLYATECRVDASQRKIQGRTADKERRGNQQGRQLVKNYVILTQVGEE